MTRRREHRQIRRFQFRLPVDIPRLVRFTKTQRGVRSMSAISRAVDVNRPVRLLCAPDAVLAALTRTAPPAHAPNDFPETQFSLAAKPKTEREGFEPSVPLRVHRFSRPAHSATLSPLRLPDSLNRRTPRSLPWNATPNQPWHVPRRQQPQNRRTHNTHESDERHCGAGVNSWCFVSPRSSAAPPKKNAQQAPIYPRTDARRFISSFYICLRPSLDHCDSLIPCRLQCLILSRGPDDFQLGVGGIVGNCKMDAAALG